MLLEPEKYETSEDEYRHQISEIAMIGINQAGVMTIDAALIEFREVYDVRIPYISVPTLTGPCFKWDPIFIENVLIAMSTDSMVQFNSDEVDAFRMFVNFQNYHSHSALESDANGSAAGCTVPNEKNQSFVVAQDGQIMDGTNGMLEILCQQPGFEVEGEIIWKSLDLLLMDLYNCTLPDMCNRGLSIFDSHPCTNFKGN